MPTGTAGSGRIVRGLPAVVEHKDSPESEALADSSRSNAEPGFIRTVDGHLTGSYDWRAPKYLASAGALRIAESCAPPQDVRRPAVRELVVGMAARDRRPASPELHRFNPRLGGSA